MNPLTVRELLELLFYLCLGPLIFYLISKL